MTTTPCMHPPDSGTIRSEAETGRPGDGAFGKTSLRTQDGRR